MSAFEWFVQSILDDDFVFATVEDVIRPQLATDFDKIYYYRDCVGWVKSLAFKRRLFVPKSS